MGHSTIIGYGVEMEVRESTFDIVLERLLDEIERLPANDTKEVAQKTVSAWNEYWQMMAPGCGTLDVGGLPHSLRQLLRSMVVRIQASAAASSDTARVAQRLGDLLSHGEIY